MPVLEVKNLKKNFGKTEVLKGVGFSLEKGEVLAIIGSSGGGKTTLLRCCSDVCSSDLFADGGQILVNGNTIFDADDKRKQSEAEIRKNRLHFGLVFQQFNLFPQYSVLKNVTLASTLLGIDTAENITARATELIKRVGLADKMNSYPCELSGGQQQRVAIARALALDPDILCFDEPTSALDPELTGEVLRVIKSLKEQDRTMLIVTHEMEFAKNVADKIMFIADGLIEEYGTPEQVFNSPKSPKTKAFLSKSLESI